MCEDFNHYLRIEKIFVWEYKFCTFYTQFFTICKIEHLFSSTYDHMNGEWESIPTHNYLCMIQVQKGHLYKCRCIQKKRTWKKQFKNSSKSRFRANRRNGCSHLKHIQMLQMSIECSAYCAPVHIVDECHSWLDVEAVKQNKKKNVLLFYFYE